MRETNFHGTGTTAWDDAQPEEIHSLEDAQTCTCCEIGSIITLLNTLVCKWVTEHSAHTMLIMAAQ